MKKKRTIKSIWRAIPDVVKILTIVVPASYFILSHFAMDDARRQYMIDAITDIRNAIADLKNDVANVKEINDEQDEKLQKIYYMSKNKD